MKKLSQLVSNKSTVLSDGAWGTNLQRKGLEIGECPEEWNINHPELVEEVARDFIEAGSRLVKTNSFGGSRFKLEQYGLGERTSEINRLAGELSRKAAGEDVIVMGSIGPTGKMLITGEVSEDDLYEAFKQQATALEEGGVDVILVETMSDLDEARLAVQAASDNTACEIACTMTFEKTVDGDYKTMMGIAPAQMFPVIPDAGATLIGSNCGNGIERMVEVVREIRAVNSEMPVVVHANAGMPVYEEGKTIFPETPDEMASYVPQLVEAGANVIGGCCGTTPEHVKKIGEKLKG
ncbi:MAG: homocysteine S-methyltransferase family protein [Bacteroidales bacterium]|nr:homocysteine S-methyltransferase family protein [Bacteroidales bacterium]MBS3808385.1 homocysteine S-methyltransferase family protein [Bacteroidales bacterium]